MKSKKFEIPSMGHMSFSSKKVLASVVAGLLFAAPVFATVETVAPSIGFAEHVAYAEENDSVVHFKDENLKKALLKYMKDNHMISSDATEITKTDALKVKIFSTTNATSPEYIQSIEGIENFKNLTQLGLGLNYISDIKPLAGLTNLTLLALYDNSISDITPLKGLTNLTSLSIQRNEISDITPLKGLTNLTFLALGGNQISDIKPLTNLTDLTTLGLFNNQISDIKPLTNLTNLTSLWIGLNHISDITPLKGLTNLTSLKLDYNQIQNLVCMNSSTSSIGADRQIINLQPTTTTVDLKKEIKGFGNVTFDPDENITNGVLTHKEGMKNPYQVKVHEENGEHKYSATINVDFSKAKINSETQTENISEQLQKLLDGYNAVKNTDNYKNADDNLKQVYDKAITDGKVIYDKLSSTPEQVKAAAQAIQTALGKLNGDAKASASTSQLQNRIQQLEQELDKLKQQHTADASTIQSLTQQLQQTKQQLEKLKQDKTLSDQQKQAEIDKLNGQITELGKQIEKLTQENTSLKGQIATLQVAAARLIEEANTIAMYRLYNPWTGEHLFTTDAHEVQTLVALGWQDEGIIGQVNTKEGKAVYRLYNPNTGEHHYTTDAAEVERCVANGWVKEGIAFYSQGDQAVFSMYNPYAKSFYHHYTSNEKEIAQMIKDGWKKEEVKWYCAPVQPHTLIKQ